jgi:hypothetical protein
MNNEWKGYGRKQLWPNLRYYPVICMEELKKITTHRTASVWVEF